MKIEKKSFHSKIKNGVKNVVSKFETDSLKTLPLRVYAVLINNVLTETRWKFRVRNFHINCLLSIGDARSIQYPSLPQIARYQQEQNKREPRGPGVPSAQGLTGLPINTLPNLSVCETSAKRTKYISLYYKKISPPLPCPELIANLFVNPSVC